MSACSPAAAWAPRAVSGLLHDGQASCQAACSGRGTVFIGEIRQLMRDGSQSSCSSAEVEGRRGGEEGKAHFEIKNGVAAGG